MMHTANLFYFPSNILSCVCVYTQSEDKQKASQQFTKLQAAMKVLSISSDEQKALWLILGAIYHLGAAGATKGNATLTQSDSVVCHGFTFKQTQVTNNPSINP